MHLGLEFVTAVGMEQSIFWGMSVESQQSFEGISSGLESKPSQRREQGEQTGSSETSVNFQRSTRSYTLEDKLFKRLNTFVTVNLLKAAFIIRL
jgi:hypothetical protein